MHNRPLWAPWRIDYITAPKGDSCPICLEAPPKGEPTAAQKQISTLVIDHSPSAFTMLNAFPYASGHVMVSPIRHVSDPTELDCEETMAMMRLTSRAIKSIRSAMNPEGFNIGLNVGTAAGAGIADHLHIHIVPRWSGDNNFMPVLADTRVVPQALSTTAEVLRSALSTIDR